MTYMWKRRPSIKIGTLLLGVWLIVHGLLPLLRIGNPTIHALVAILGIAAGVFVLLQR